MKKISILGSTGFIGTNTLRIIAQFPDRFQVVGLAAGKNVQRILQQIQTFHPEIVSVDTPDHAEALCRALGGGKTVTVRSGTSGMIEVASHTEAELVVSALVGWVGLTPTMAAIQAGKNVALANKETLVIAGRLVMEAARKQGVDIIPIDSEHSAIFQALQGHHKDEVHRLLLTASGGPFLNLPAASLAKVSPEQALQHPNWEMGKKTTIDSATLMNKGLEVIEARWLFDLGVEKIQVVIHPQSIIHSLVEYWDGSTLAQLSLPDMTVPIAYALAYPDRLPLQLRPLALAEVGQLTFCAPDAQRFPCLNLAYQALLEEESMAAVLNGANEVAVEAFLQHQIGLVQIPEVIEKTMETHSPRRLNDIPEAIEMNAWARRTGAEIMRRFHSDH